MFSTLNLHLEKVEVRKVPGMPAPFRREMVWGFAENEFYAFLDKIRANRIGESDITEFCDRHGKLALSSDQQAKGVDSSDTIVILHFKEESKETLTHYYTVMGVIGDTELRNPLPDDAVFTPLYYWDYMVMNNTHCILGNAIEFHHVVKGFEIPETVIQPGQLLERSIVADMANAEYYGAEFRGMMCSLTPTQLSLREHNSPSAYLRSVIDAALNARDYVKNNLDEPDLTVLGIQDCAQYLMGKEACVYSSPALFLFNGIQTEPLTIGQLRRWFSVFDNVVEPTLTIMDTLYPFTEHTGSTSIKETLCQELTLNAMIEMAKVGLREMQIYSSSDSPSHWVASDAVAVNPYLKNIDSLAQNVCDRLHKQFFTKYAELMYNIRPAGNMRFDVAGISSVALASGSGELASSHGIRYTYPTYKLSAWSPMIMSSERANHFSQQVYHYVREMINQ